MDIRDYFRTGKIRLHRPLEQDFYDGNGVLLLRKGYQIDSEEQLEELINRGSECEGKQEQAVLQPSRIHRSSFEAWEALQKELQELLRKPRLDGSFPDEVRHLAEQIKSATLRSSNAAIAAMMLADCAIYPISHSIHVAFLVNLLTIRLDWTEDNRMQAMCAALTMNIAMIRLQGDLCKSLGTLNADQKHAIRIHPTVGVALLRRLGVTDEGWLQAVLEHHEAPGGEGYPGGIDNPCELAMIIRTCDIFSAKISPRASRKPMDAAQAAKVLFLSEGVESRNPYSALLIKEVGIYPPGSIVKLYNNEVAIVTRRGQHAHAPIVMVLKNSSGSAVLDTIVRDTSRKEFSIQSSMLREDISIPLQPNRIWP
jgi:HD-GYP domain-containing protein (c-di-GMP phosphodiesterase class II)